MAEAKRLPVLKLMAPALAKFQPYIGQEPSNNYLDKVIQSWAYLKGHMTVLEMVEILIMQSSVIF